MPKLVIALIVTVWPLLSLGQESSSTFELTISPRALDESAFALRLLPEESQLREGNAAPVLLRMVHEQHNYLQQVAPKFLGWLDAPFDDQGMRSGLNFDHFFKQLRRAAYIRNADFNYPIGEEPSFSILLPDVQTSRIFLERGLSLYIRKAVADDNPELAREGIFVGLAGSRHYAQTPFLVCQMCAIACANRNLEQANFLIQHQHAENLFWAYEKLPAPLFDLSASASLETNMLENSIPSLIQEPWPAHNETDEWVTIASQISGQVLVFFEDHQTLLEKAAMLQRVYTYLRANWQEIGDETKGEVEQMCNEELAVRFYLIKSKETYERFKVALALDPPDAIQFIKQSEESLERLGKEIGIPQLQNLFLRPMNLYAAAWRPTRRVVGLQTVEALRHYAAKHGGKLPNSLEDIDDIPVPKDPFTGKAMGYKLSDDGSATLIMANPRVLAAYESQNSFELKYRINVAKE